jgi:hypothetical protein
LGDASEGGLEAPIPASAHRLRVDTVSWCRRSGESSAMDAVQGCGPTASVTLQYRTIKLCVDKDAFRQQERGHRYCHTNKYLRCGSATRTSSTRSAALAVKLLPRNRRSCILKEKEKKTRRVSRKVSSQQKQALFHVDKRWFGW